MKYTGCLAFFLLFCMRGAVAQPYNFRHYQVEDGLPNNSVLCSLQDRKGFMWFGTRDGLCRFDGYTFKSFARDPDEPQSIGHNAVLSLYEDEQQILWVGTSKGLYMYDAGTDDFELVKQTGEKNIKEVKGDGNGLVWFVSSGAIWGFNKLKNELLIEMDLQGMDATSLLITPKKKIWIATTNGSLIEYTPATHSTKEIDLFKNSSSLKPRRIQHILQASDNSILVGTANYGVKLFNTETGQNLDLLINNEDRTAIFARDFLRVSDNTFWIATELGIFVYNLATKAVTHLKKELKNQYGLSDNAIYSLTLDREGGIWATTYFKGVDYFASQPLVFQNYYPQVNSNSISGEIVREICKDKFGNLWIGTEDAGLNKLDAGTGHFEHFKPTGSKKGITYYNIHGLLPYDNELWVGTFEHGLDVMDIASGDVKRHYRAGNGKGQFKSDFIVTMYRTKTDDILIGTRAGLYRYRKQTDDFELVEAPGTAYIYAIHQNAAGTIWVGTVDRGLFYYNLKTKQSGQFLHKPNDTTSLAGNIINSIFEDSKHTLWIATKFGLSKYLGNNRFSTLTTKDGLPSNLILKVLEDNQGNLWISTQAGLAKYNPTTNAVRNFTKNAGIISVVFNYNAAFKDSAGTMYFGTTKGMVSFKPGEIKKASITNPLYITGFQVNNNEVDLHTENSPLSTSIISTKAIKLPYNRSSFSIDFAAVGFTSPDMVEYAYMMEGLDDEWTYLKSNRKVYFTELSPGNYTFKVKTVNNNGRGAAVTLQIKITPPFWRSIAAYVVYVLLAIATLLLLIKNYHRRVYERNKKRLQQLEHQKNKELYEAKMTFFTHVAHEIKTPLTLIKGPLDVIEIDEMAPPLKNHLKCIERNTDRLITLANQLLDFRQVETSGFSLNFSLVNITALLQETHEDFKLLARQKHLDFRLQLPLKRLTAMVDEEAMIKIVSNLYSNAIKYAATLVSIRLHEVQDGDQHFTIVFENDGNMVPAAMRERIFEPFVRLKQSVKSKGTGIGLALTRSLVEFHNGTISVQTNNQKNCFILTLPLLKKQ